MPFVTDWLNMPSATPEPGPSLFDPPALRSIGARPSRRESMLEQRDAQAAQKMAAYQAATRKMEMQKLASDEARAVLPVLQSLDPTAPDYQERRGQLLSQFPLSAEDPSVSNVARAHDTMLMGIRQKQEAAARETADIQKLFDEDPPLRYMFEQRAKIDGPEAAMTAIKAQVFNDAQARRLTELGEDPKDPRFDLGNGYLNKREIDMLEAKKKVDDENKRKSEVPSRVKEKYAEAKRDGFKEDVDLYESIYPQLKQGSSLPVSTASDTSKASPAGGNKTSRGITFKRESD